VENDVDVLHVEIKLVMGFSFIRDIDLMASSNSN
jgi:hypothetical protein